MGADDGGGGLATLARALIGAGLGLAALGAVLLMADRFTGGKGLPGDLQWGRGNVRVYFPFATMLVVSLLLTLVLNLLARWRR
jgi:hypothetical protein